MGRARGESVGVGDAVLLLARAARVRDVAGALQLSPADELPGRHPRGAAVRRRVWDGVSSGRPSGATRAAGPWRNGCPGWRSSASTSACSCRSTPAAGSREGSRPGRLEGVRPLGLADRPPLRGGRLDRAPADADARDHGGGRLMKAPRERSSPSGSALALICSGLGRHGPRRRRDLACLGTARETARSPSSPTLPVRRRARWTSACSLLDRATGEPDPGGPRRGRGLARGPARSGHHGHLATEQAATNKLFRAAVFELRAAGRCDVTVAIDRPADQARVEFALDVARPSFATGSGRGFSGPCR